ncbi:hypothetical protein FB382_001207 [Nocardioides ginsengisegetis]|uniref:Lipoprotein n=1 Tax=Nocardioides ginsengisegetis TaxID=661491 RepID=A0A7W3P901_9ACTN|nr:hypothetical protein [Nocardioides ginsengisegetis]MBA8802916.1 hypothetical protein [Nocardioides ginsengisegetis]
MTRAATTARARRALAASSIVLLGSLLSACGDDSSTPSSADSSSGAPTSQAVPSQGSADNPFDSSLVGPTKGQPGQVLTETLTNTGRLPDAYQVVIDPAEAARVKVSSFTLGPGESAKVKILVLSTPFDVHLKTAGGGAPDTTAMTIS